MKRERTRCIVAAMLISIACLSIGLTLCSVLSMPFPHKTANQIYLRDLVPRVVTALILLAFMKMAYRKVPIGLGKEGFWYGMLISFLMYLYIAENFLDGSSVKAPVDMKGVPIITYVLCLGSNLAIGLFEEVLLRGTILNIMKAYWKRFRYGTYAAVLGSSFLFGSVHMMNYINGHAYLRPTIAQVFYATFLGIFLGAVYVRSKNLWVVILLHGLFDFAAEFWELVTPTYSFHMQDMSWDGVRYLICLYLPLAYVGLYLTYREVKEERKEKEERRKRAERLYRVE